MEERIKKALGKTYKVKKVGFSNKTQKFIVGFSHKIEKEDPEYYVLLMMKDKEKMIVDDQVIERFFQNDYKKALETARIDINFDKLQEDQKVEILINLIRNADFK